MTEESRGGRGRWAFSRGRAATLSISACLFAIPVLFLLFSVGIVAVVGWSDYGSILRAYTRYRPNGFDVQTLSRTVFTPDWHSFVHTYRWLWIAGILSSLLFYLFRARSVWTCLRSGVEYSGRMIWWLGESFRQLDGWQKLGMAAVFAGILAYRIYFFLSLPPSTDEACSYVYFAHQGVLVTAFCYPIPNNHILFNLICAMLDKVPGLGGRAVMRLPSLAANLFLLYCLFSLFFRQAGFRKAIVMLAGIGICFYPSFYAVQGRGYELQAVFILAAVMAWWRVWGAVPEKSGAGRSRRPEAECLFAVCSIAAFYITPTYLYYYLSLVFLTIYISLVRREPRLLIRLMQVSAWVGALTLVLYLPVILASSWYSLFAETQRKGYGYAALTGWWGNFSDFSEDLCYSGRGLSPWLVLFFFAAVLFLWRKKKVLSGDLYKYAFQFGAAMIVTMFLMTLHSKMYPFDRTISAWILGLQIIFVSSFFDCAVQLRQGRTLVWAIAIFLLVKTALSMRGIVLPRNSIGNRFEVRAYRGIESDLERLDSLHPSSWQITKSDDFYPMYLRWRLIGRKENGKVEFGTDRAKADVIFLPERFKDSFDLKGYLLWGNRKETMQSRVLDIYIDKKLLLSQ